MRRLLAFCLLALYAAAQTPLMDYVNKPDSHYSWFDTGFRYNTSGQGWTGYMLNMTSQQWLTSNDSDRSVWTHQLLVVVPDTVDSNTYGAVYVTGGGNQGPKPPGPTDEDVLVAAILATETNTICATLWQVPNEPIVFTADKLQKERSEDALVAFTWYEYAMNQERPEWIAYFPMVKSVVRAMDTVNAFAKQLNPSNDINKFLIAGASKRGATTWLTGAYDGSLPDKRVVGIVPIVFDMLNFYNNVPHMYQAYNGWTFAFRDYWDMNITQFVGTSKMAALSKQVDPLAYKQWLTMPKLVVDATGDEFFMPDDDYFWWGQLEGETYRLMVQNCEHSMATGVLELIVGARAFYASLIMNTPRPSFTWVIDETNGDLTAVSQGKPNQVTLWKATTLAENINRRDFRLFKGNTTADPCTGIVVKVFGGACFNPVLWFSTNLDPVSVSNNTYTYFHHEDPPADGMWTGFFIEFGYDGPAITDFQMTTQVSIVPRTYPFAPCGSGPSCIGVLV